jgi:spectinomycin phosphotransferase
MNQKKHYSVFEHFGFEYQNPDQSIYPFSPVFKIKDLILKKTRSPIESAYSLHQWCEELEASGVSVVTPVTLPMENPVTIDEEVWVVYPFIDGKPYTGSLSQIKAAGEMLGKMHALNTGTLKNLPSYSWPDETIFDSFTEDFDSLRNITSKAKYDLSKQTIKILEKACHEFDNDCTTLKDANLPCAGGTWDYKANNLIFDGETPVLVDPDSAGFLPRILDLALALVLFHNEIDTAPPRLFTIDEWHAFYEGYSKYVTLTAKEIQLWDTAKRYMYLEEAFWLMANDDEGWKQKHQRAFLVSLLNGVDRLVQYSLP